MWDLGWAKWNLDRFLPENFVFPVSFNSLVLLYREKRRKLIILNIFITSLQNKPQGCGASVASAAGPFTTKKVSVSEI
jgi:hypothetical protein